MAQGFVTGDEYVKLPRAPEMWIVEHLLPASGKLNIYGKQKMGKSYAALQLAAAIAGGEADWLSFPILTHGPVCYLQVDTPRTLWADRIERTAVSGCPKVHMVHYADAEQAPYPFNILDPLPNQGYQWVREQVSAIKPMVVIIDTLREIHEGDEDSSMQMRNVMAHLEAATRPAALVLISHSRKDKYDNSGKPLDDDLLQGNRGSSYIPGRMDAILRISNKLMTYKGRTTDEHRIKISQDKHTGLWSVDESETQRLVEAVIANKQLPTQMAKARELAQETGKTLTACRRLIQRHLDQHGTKSVSAPLRGHVDVVTGTIDLDWVSDDSGQQA